MRWRLRITRLTPALLVALLLMVVSAIGALAAGSTPKPPAPGHGIAMRYVALAFVAEHHTEVGQLDTVLVGVVAVVDVATADVGLVIPGDAAVERAIVLAQQIYCYDWLPARSVPEHSSATHAYDGSLALLYVNGDPINLIDPSGHRACSDMGTTCSGSIVATGAGGDGGADFGNPVGPPPAAPNDSLHECQTVASTMPCPGGVSGSQTDDLTPVHSDSQGDGVCSQILNACYFTYAVDASKSLNEGEVVQVSGYLRQNGTYVDPYLRTVKGGKAAGQFLGRFVMPAEFALGAVDQYSRDQRSGGYSPAQLLARSTEAGATTVGVSALGWAAGRAAFVTGGRAGGAALGIPEDELAGLPSVGLGIAGGLIGGWLADQFVLKPATNIVVNVAGFSNADSGSRTYGPPN